MKLNYVIPAVIDKAEYVRKVDSGDMAMKCEAIVSAVHSISDYAWLVSRLSELLLDADLQVKGVAITCVGHLARICKDSNKDELLQLVSPFLSDMELGGRAEDAIDDINSFL